MVFYGVKRGSKIRIPLEMKYKKVEITSEVHVTPSVNTFTFILCSWPV